MAYGFEIRSTGRFSRYADHFMRREAPADHLLMWAVAGRGRMATGAFSGRAEAGSLMLLPRGRAQDYASDREQPWDLLWMHFGGNAADGWAASFERRFGLLVDFGTSPALIDAFTEVITANHGGEAERRLANHLGWAVLGRIEHRLLIGLGGTASHHVEAIERVQQHVLDHLEQTITVEDLASVAHVSPRQLTRLCRSAWGVSPMRYVIGQRLARASSLLAETALPVGRVAEASGFSDPYHFSRLFREHMGEPPRAYRKRRRESEAGPAEVAPRSDR
ncbi:MAG: helix-turn-helix domain-containing protein [Phycisphaeraceae bacterium]